MCGWAQSTDGVEALVQGDPKPSFVAWCRRGPPLARVADVASADAAVDTGLEAFEMRFDD
jgi:hypothetical protein